MSIKHVFKRCLSIPISQKTNNHKKINFYDNFLFFIFYVFVLHAFFFNLAKHSTDYKDDSDESAKDENEDNKENIDKKEKGKLIFLNILYIYIFKRFYLNISCEI